jgi:pimeloyl-ACP methyl ester carboxylesterase
VDVRYPAIEPYETGMLDVGDGDLVYWETCGNPAGKPALVVHGGPGSGCRPGTRRSFDPARYRVVLFDQRMCGLRRPLADDPAVDLAANTTDHLIADMERLRVHLPPGQGTERLRRPVGPSDPVAAQAVDAARHLADELSHPSSPRGAVAAARELSAAAETALQAAVDRARAAGQSWRDIGEVLGTTRQAAFQRFGHPIDPRTGEPMSCEIPPDAADRGGHLRLARPGPLAGDPRRARRRHARTP